MEQQISNDPILQLINYVAEELQQEILLNEDSTGFWKKAQDYIFDNSVASVREGIDTLSEGIGESPDLYNYLSVFVFRVFSQPYTISALDNFSKGFDMVAGDVFFRDGFNFKAGEMTKVQQLLLFITVHRNQIQIAFLQAEEAAERERQEAAARLRRGRNQQ
ncbi:hypothetical protein YUBABA_01320 [Serratia phage vB_SmaM-Yubaba]|nr:hypothetical protein SUREIYA_01040 [Serratia phage vB_SmaM-Sureiya]UQT03338.1 hypothetical protein YUBABA_01320 [Serratia phage vB_SmaM-Yubaba]